MPSAPRWLRAATLALLAAAPPSRAPADAEPQARDPYAQEHRRLLNETSGTKPSSP
ncbi:MAG: hypothetical protein K2Y35_22010 [Burkholderiales bacterium]|nr:hypothetical protein [Burkholderiales bacterium]